MLILDQISPSKLIDKSYILDIKPTPNGYYQYLGIIFGLLLAAAIYLSLRKSGNSFQKLRRKFVNLFLTIGLIGLTLIFFRFEGIAYLGSRLMIVILMLVFVLWLGVICWYRYYILPKELKEKLEKEKFEKYLPKNTKTYLRRG